MKLLFKPMHFSDISIQSCGPNEPRIRIIQGGNILILSVKDLARFIHELKILANQLTVEP